MTYYTIILMILLYEELSFVEKGRIQPCKIMVQDIIFVLFVTSTHKQRYQQSSERN